MMLKIALLLLSLFCPCIIFAAAESTDMSILVISDIHLDVSTQHTMSFEPNGYTLSNDLDVPTFHELIAEIKLKINTGQIAKPQYILLLGDLVGHFRHSKDAARVSETQVFETIRQAFPTVPIIYTVGNNDSLVKNYGPFRALNNQKYYQTPFDMTPQADFVATSKLCSQTSLAYPCVIARNDDQGYYSAYLAPHLSVVSLNSVLFSPLATEDEAAANEQLKWLDQQLQRAYQKNDRVLLVSHIPPGNNTYGHAWHWSDTGKSFWTPTCTSIFLHLLTQYKAHIMGVLAAHTHKDELKIIQNNQQGSMGVYISAALSTMHGNAPSIRSYELRRSHDQWDVYNYVVYRFERSSEDRVVAKFLYDYRAQYCHDNASSINSCLNNVSIRTLQYYYTAGNPRYRESIRFPENLTLNIQD